MLKEVCEAFRGLRLIVTLAGAMVILTGWFAPASAASAKEIDKMARVSSIAAKGSWCSPE